MDGGIRLVGVVIDAALAQRLTDHPQRRLHPPEPITRRVEAEPGGLVLGSVPAGAKADLEPPVRHGVDRCQLLRQHRRMPQIVVKHQGADAQPRGLGGGLQPRERTPAAEVIGGQEHVRSGGLGAARRLDHAIAASLSSLQDHAESEGTSLGWLGGHSIGCRVLRSGPVNTSAAAAEQAVRRV